MNVRTIKASKVEDRGKSMFDAAVIYARAAQYLSRAFESDNSMFWPINVIEALALEIYCKSLYYIKYGRDFKIDGRYSHDFHELFNQLPPEMRRELESDFQSILQKRNMNDVAALEAASTKSIPRDLIGILQEWSTVFVEIRYMYQKPKDGKVMMFFPEVEQVLRNAIFKLKPELQP